MNETLVFGCKCKPEVIMHILAIF